MIAFPGLRLTAPTGSIIGIIEEGGRSLSTIDIEAISLAPGDPMPGDPGDYILDHTLSRTDAVGRSKAIARLVQLRRDGATIALISHDEILLESCADEIWWLRAGELIARGDPADVLQRYRVHVANMLRASGENQIAPLSPTMRTGDGRAKLESVEMLGENAVPANVFRSGEAVTVNVNIRFLSPVADPVVGIMIRTRIGLNVYGTNTELEQLKLGPVSQGDGVCVTYQFRCDLCPGDYTITAASHDPDGVWHDWMEDAVAFSVSDSRYTAGVANLRAHVKVQPLTV